MKIADIRLQVEMVDEEDCNMFVQMIDDIAKMLLGKGKWVALKADYIDGFVPPSKDAN